MVVNSDTARKVKNILYMEMKDTRNANFKAAISSKVQGNSTMA
jgi:hypothetical protein